MKALLVVLHRCIALGMIAVVSLTACTAAGSSSSIPLASQAPAADQTLVVTTVTATTRPPILQPFSTPTPNPNPTQTDPRGVILSSLRKLQQAGPFHIHSVTTSSDGKSVTLDGDILLPDRFHIQGTDLDVLIVGNQAYSQQDGRWVKLDTDLGNPISGLVAEFSGQAALSISDAAFIKTEILDGLPTHVYQYRASLNLGDKTYTGQNQVWISDASGLPVHLETAGDLAGVHSTTVQTLRYDPSINIEVPTP